MKADFSAFLFQANDAVDFVGAEQMAMLDVAETALWAMEVPEGLAHHGCLSLTFSQSMGNGDRVAQEGARQDQGALVI
jgi:hypothetical protein